MVMVMEITDVLLAHIMVHQILALILVNLWGAPLSSRFIVIERIKRSIQKYDLCGHIKYKNSNIGIRTLKLMSKSDSLYKRFLLEVSLEHFDCVTQEIFWPPGVRV